MRMSKHRVPTWMNVCWLVFVSALLLSVVGVALRRGYDVAQTIGFLMASFGLIFTLAVVMGLILYGLSILLEGVKAHKSNCDDDDNSGYGLIP